MNQSDVPRAIAKWPMMCWGLLLVCAITLWSLGQRYQPRAEIFVGLMVVLILGAKFCGARGWIECRSGRDVFSLANLAIGSSACAAVAVFVAGVLANVDSVIEVQGPKPAWMDVIVKRFRLVNLNVLHGYPDFEQHESRFQETVAELKAHDAHVVILQEAWITKRSGNMAYRLRHELGGNYVYARANGSWNHLGFEEGSVIWSRFPIVEARRILLKPSEPWWENRIALLATLDVPGQGHVTVAGVHLGLANPDDQAEHLTGC